jgi:hypothetical protein
MEKNEKIELLDQIQMGIWLVGLAIIGAITIWAVVDGRTRSLASGGIMGLLCVTNYNIVLNRIAIRNARRKTDTDTSDAA